MNRIRLTKLWPTEERSLKGIALSQHQTSGGHNSSDSISFSQTGPFLTTTAMSSQSAGGSSLSSSTINLDRWILLPWTSPQEVFSSSTSQLTQPTSIRTAPQALVGCSLVGSILGFWRLRPSLYPILFALQTVMQTTYECRPLLGNSHDRFRSLSTPMVSTVDGDLLQRFLVLNHGLQIELVKKAVGLERLVETWLQLQEQTMGMSVAERDVLILMDYCDRNRGGHGQGRRGGTCLEHGPSSRDRSACGTVHVIGHILVYLQSLDWHQ